MAAETRRKGAAGGRRRGQSLSSVVILLLTLTILVVVIVTSIVANAEFNAMFGNHLKSREALLIASKITGAPQIALDMGREGLHKNMLDTRRLDTLNRTHRAKMPASAYVFCYNWRAEIYDTDLKKYWEFGARNPARDAMYELCLAYGWGMGGAAYGGQFEDPSCLAIAQGADSSDVGEDYFVIPVTLVNYAGNKLKNYTFGAMRVAVWANSSQCIGENDREKQYNEAVRLIESAPLFVPTSSQAELPYQPKSIAVPGGATYSTMRCEELLIERIRMHFDEVRAENMKARAPAYTDRIEEAARAADVDANLLRAVVAGRSGFSPEYPNGGFTGLPASVYPTPPMDVSENLAAAATLLRQYLDQASTQYNGGHCSLNYAIYAYLTSGEVLSQYVAGTLKPSGPVEAVSQDIISLFDKFNSCSESIAT